MERPEIPHKLVWVEWQDSRRPAAHWQWMDEFEVQHEVHCVSVGWLVAETARTLALAPNLGDLAYERTQAAGVMEIARCAVIRMYCLTPPGGPMAATKKMSRTARNAAVKRNMQGGKMTFSQAVKAVGKGAPRKKK